MKPANLHGKNTLRCQNSESMNSYCHQNFCIPILSSVKKMIIGWCCSLHIEEREVGQREDSKEHHLHLSCGQTLIICYFALHYRHWKVSPVGKYGSYKQMADRVLTKIIIIIIAHNSEWMYLVWVKIFRSLQRTIK